MPRPARTPDFLHLHANVNRRVRNLETGVHPTAADTGYADTVYYTRLTVTNPKLEWWGALTSFPAYPAWQRHAGIVTLMGGIEPRTGYTDWVGIDAEELVLTLPAGARPQRELIVIAAAPQTIPPTTTLRIAADGGLWVTKPPYPGGGVRFEGASWTID